MDRLLEVISQNSSLIEDLESSLGKASEERLNQKDPNSISGKRVLSTELNTLIKLMDTNNSRIKELISEVREKLGDMSIL